MLGLFYLSQIIHKSLTKLCLQTSLNEVYFKYKVNNQLQEKVMSTRSKNLAHELMLLVFAFAVIVVASFMTSCASLDPQAEFGLGYGWGDKYGADKGETEATPVGFTSFTIGKKYKHFNLRGGVYHWSDPATFEDFGKTSLIGTVRFGGK